MLIVQNVKSKNIFSGLSWPTVTEYDGDTSNALKMKNGQTYAFNGNLSDGHCSSERKIMIKYNCGKNIYLSCFETKFTSPSSSGGSAIYNYGYLNLKNSCKNMCFSD